VIASVFVPFSPQILAWALEKWTPPSPAKSDWYCFQDSVYQNLGYALVGNTAVRPPKATSLVTLRKGAILIGADDVSYSLDDRNLDRSGFIARNAALSTRLSSFRSEQVKLGDRRSAQNTYIQADSF